MKKFYLIFTVISAIGLLVFFGCSKENNQTLEKQNDVFQPTEKDLQIENKILAFKDKIDQVRENPNLKSGNEPFAVDSAIWFVEALSNLTYGDAGTPFGNYIVDTCELVVPVSNGSVEILDLQIAYDQMIGILSNQFAQISEPEKHMVVNDVSLKASDENNLTLGVTTGYGIEGASGSGSFDPTDYWYWGWDMGKCDGSGQGVGSDAADKIERWANINIAVPCNSYYTDPEITDWIYPYHVPSSGNPFGYGDYLLFDDYQEVNLIHPCLAPNMMNYYLSSLQTIANLPQYKPEDKSIISYQCEDDYMAGITPNWDDWWNIVHKAKIKYGIWHISSDPPNEL